jgi:hypothetical protein
MRSLILGGMFLIASLLGASSCAGERDEADEQSSEAANAVVSDPSRDAASQCPPGYMCMWDYPNYGGQMWGTKDPGCANMPPSMNNKCSSWWNRSPGTYHMYSGPSCMGAEVVAPPGMANPDVMGPMDNQVSSVCLGPSCM